MGRTMPPLRLELVQTLFGRRKECHEVTKSSLGHEVTIERKSFEMNRKPLARERTQPGDERKEAVYCGVRTIH